MVGVPGARCGIGEVHDGHTGLPEVPLPDGVTGALEVLLVCIQ